MQVLDEVFVEGDHEVVVDFTLTCSLLGDATRLTDKVSTIGCSFEKFLEVRLSRIAVSCLCVKTEAVGQTEIFQEVIIELQFSVET